MKTLLGIDMGASSTKIAALSDTGELMASGIFECVRDVGTLEGILPGFLNENGLSADNIGAAAMTGVGTAFVGETVCGIRMKKVSEFDAVARGALTLSGMDMALVASIGTGTSFVLATKNGAKHMGGSAMGGGTIMGLAEKLIGETDAETLSGLAENGNLGCVDLLMADIGTAPNLPQEATASNFGKVGHEASPADLAAGLMNLVFQNMATMAVFLIRNTEAKNVVVIGSAAGIKQAKHTVDAVGNLYGVNFIIPKDPAFATAVGTALLA